jgi:cytochrome oxidase Cu insertion factor (SCO1/SenC/PrrC family)
MINKNAIKIIIACLFINIFSGSLLSMEPFDIRHFRIENLEGKRFDSRKALGEPFVISFFFTRCPPCWKEMPELFSYMKKEGRLHQLLFVDSYVEAEGIEVHDNPDTKRMIEKYAEDFKINPANVYFDTLGSFLKKFIRIGAFPKAKAAKTKVIWPTILVISATGKLVESIEGSRPDFIEVIDKHL